MAVLRGSVEEETRRGSAHVAAVKAREQSLRGWGMREGRLEELIVRSRELLVGRKRGERERGGDAGEELGDGEMLGRESDQFEEGRRAGEELDVLDEERDLSVIDGKSVEWNRIVGRGDSSGEEATIKAGSVQMIRRGRTPGELHT